MTLAELREVEKAGVITQLELDYLLLHDVKGLSYRQIALARGVSHQTVHERCRRAHGKIERARSVKAA